MTSSPGSSVFLAISQQWQRSQNSRHGRSKMWPSERKWPRRARKTGQGWMCPSTMHELCSSRPKQVGTQEEVRPGQKRKRPAVGGPKVCWLYNDGECTLKNCKFTHRCKWCMGNHPRRACSSRSGGDLPKPLPRLPGSYSGVEWGRQ